MYIYHYLIAITITIVVVVVDVIITITIVAHVDSGIVVGTLKPASIGTATRLDTFNVFSLKPRH